MCALERQEETATIAFSAMAYGVSQESQGKGSLALDKVITNMGDGLSESTATFTAPIKGGYVFHVAAIAKGRVATTLLLLHKDNVVMTTGPIGKIAQDVYPFGSNQIVLHLDAGDVVELKVKQPGKHEWNNVGILDTSSSDVSFVGYRL